MVRGVKVIVMLPAIALRDYYTNRRHNKMETPIHCPRCKGSGKIKLHTGRPDNIIPFSIEHWEWARRCKENDKVVDLHEFHIIIECNYCNGSGIVFIIPAKVVGTGG